MRLAQAVATAAILSVSGYAAIQLTSGTGPAPDYTLHLAGTTAHSGPCSLQARTWYLSTGRSDMLALGAAQDALSTQQGIFPGLQHAASMLGAATQVAQQDPPPACIDPAGAWTAMTAASAQEAQYLYLNDEEDGIPATDEVAAQLRILKGELPYSWFHPATFRKPPPVINPNPATTPKATTVSGGSSTRQPVSGSAPSGGGTTTAGPPDTSCPVLGATGVYYTPADHRRDLLQCQDHTTASGTRRIWRIVAH